MCKLSWVRLLGLTLPAGSVEDFVLLNIAHDIHDALVNLNQVPVMQGAVILFLHPFEHDALPIGLVNRHVGLALEASDFLGRLGALVQDLHQLLVDLIDSLTPVCNIHLGAFERCVGPWAVSGRRRSITRSSANSNLTVFEKCCSAFWVVPTGLIGVIVRYPALKALG
jgi:hypothetical protein